MYGAEISSTSQNSACSEENMAESFRSCFQNVFLLQQKYRVVYVEHAKVHGAFLSRRYTGLHCFGKIVRGFNGRVRARAEVYRQYTRYFDFNVGKHYWIKHDTEETFWKATPWLLKQEVPMPLEDQMLFTSYNRIKELEDALKAKDKEIKQIRKARYEELEPLVLQDRVKNAADLVRDKHMDTWTIDELAAWFVELKINHVIQFLYQNRVDGNLFINLADEDWSDMGITSRFHTRKLQLIMKAFRSRYERKLARIM